MNRLYAIALTLIVSGFTSGNLKAVEKTWTGANNSNWNLASNWLPSGIPVQADDIIFDGAISNINCDLGTTTVVKSLHIMANYEGLIRGADNPLAILTIVTNLNLEGGTLNMRRSQLKSMQQLNVAGGSLIKGNNGICSMINLTISSGSFIVTDANVEILGNFNMSGGQLQLGAGKFKVLQSFTQSAGQFTKTAGVGSINPSGDFQISGGAFNCGASAMTIKSLQLSGGQFIGGSGSVYCLGDLIIGENGDFSKVDGALYMNNNSKLISAGQFILDNTTFQANEIQLTNGTCNLGNSSVIVQGPVSAQNTIVTKGSGNTNLALGQVSNFQNCSITWGGGLLNTGSLELSSSQTSIGSGKLIVDGSFTQNGAGSFTKSGGYTSIAVNNVLKLDGGTMNLANCSNVVTGTWRQSSGTASNGAVSVLIRGRFELSGNGVYTASSNTTSIEGDFRKSGGTFTHNNGTFTMNGPTSFTYNILGNPSFNVLELVNESGVNARTYEVYGNVNVASELRLKNGSAANRPITINNGVLWLYGNLNISTYRSTTLQPGSATLRFTGSSTQQIIGAPVGQSSGYLPNIRIEKSGGQFNFANTISFGNGFSHLDSDIQFDPEAVFCMAGGSFQVDNLFIPKVQVNGTATLTSNLITLGDLEITPNGLLINGTLPVNVNGGFYNNGRCQNMSGLMNVSGIFENRGEFATNSGSLNALAGIHQIEGIFACNTGQVNVLGILSLQGGTFSCNNGLVQVSGSLIQEGGTLNGNIGGGSMTISQHFTQNGGTYDAQNGTINIGGALTMNSLFIRNEGTVNFNGIGPQSIPALYYNKLAISGTGRLITLPQGEIRIGAEIAGFAAHTSNSYITTNNIINYAANGPQEVTGFAYNSLSLSRNGLKTMTNNGSVKQVLSVKNNATFDADGSADNKKFTMLSSQSVTARLDQIPATASIIGNVNVQRWTRGGIRSNRFFASPVDTVGGMKIKQFKDDILVFGTGNAANGFDNATVFTSNIFLYDEPKPNGTEWRTPVNINEVVPTGKGILVYHLGDRTQAPLQNNTVPNAAIVDFIGTPNQGTLDLNMQCTGTCIEADNGNGWNLVANPYASPIDWDSPEWTKYNLSTTIYIWNPRINQYAQYNSANPGAATNGGSRFIGPSQSFFMKAVANNPVLIANERVKTATFPDTLLFRMSAPENQLRLVLNNDENESRDEIVLAFDETSTEGFDAQFDNYKPKLPMTISNFSLINDLGEKLGVHTISKPEVDKRIPLQLDAIASTFKLAATQLSSFGNEFEFYLENKITGQLTRIEENVSITITIPEGKEEQMSNAFALVVRKANQSASSLNSGMRAFPNPNNGDLINIWTNGSETGILEIIDARGNMISKNQYSPVGNTIKTTSLADASAGVYTLIWTTKSTRFSTRISVN